MKRLITALLGAVSLFALAGCTSDQPATTPGPTTTSPTATVQPTTVAPEASPTTATVTPSDAPATPVSEAPTSSEKVLSLQGWGDVRPGEPIPASYKIKPSWECYGPIILGPDGDELVQAFVKVATDDRSPVTKLSLVNPSVKTDAGIHIGSKLEQLKLAYPSAQQESAANSPGDTPVWVVPGDTHSLVFELETDMVSYISLQSNADERFYHFSTQICGGP